MKLFKKFFQSRTFSLTAGNVYDRIQIKPREINIQSSRVTRQYSLSLLKCNLTWFRSRPRDIIWPSSPDLWWGVKQTLVDFSLADLSMQDSCFLRIISIDPGLSWWCHCAQMWVFLCIYVCVRVKWVMTLENEPQGRVRGNATVTSGTEASEPWTVSVLKTSSPSTHQNAGCVVIKGITVLQLIINEKRHTRGKISVLLHRL